MAAKSKSISKYLGIFIENHRHFALLAYFVLYLVWFHWIEQENTAGFHVVHVALDDMIPYCEWFIIPYVLWFFYIAVAVMHTAFFNREQFYRLCTFLFVGMTIFLIVSTVYPNGCYLRPHTFDHDNIAIRLCRFIYSVDTSTNLFPSIHVYNSIAVHSCIMHCKEFEHKKYIRIGSLILCISIILSTMFIKQHSVFDVCTAFLLSYLVYHMVYAVGNIFERKTGKSSERAHRLGHV